MSDDLQARGVLRVQAEVDEFMAAMARGVQGAERFEDAAVKAGGNAAAAISGAGRDSSGGIAALEGASKRWVASVEREVAQLRLSREAYREWQARVQGIPEGVYRPAVEWLQRSIEANRRETESVVANAQVKKQAAADIAAAAKAQSDLVQRQQDYLQSLNQQVVSQGLLGSEMRKYEAALLGVSAQAAPLIAALEEQTAAQQRAATAAKAEAEAQRQAAQTKRANEGFIASLQNEANAIGRTRSELLTLQAAEKGLLEQAAPLISKIRDQERALGLYDSTARNARVSTNQLRQAFAQLPAQVNDVVVSLAGGQNPLLVLLQQGTQVSQSFGGIGGAAKTLLSTVTPLRVALGGVAAAIVAAAVAADQAQREQRAYQQALILTGGAAGVTADRLQDMARAQDAIAGTEGKAAEVLSSLAASGLVAGNNLALAARAAIALEKAGGPAIEKTVEQFVELGKAPLQTLLRLNQTQNFLTDSTYRTVKALEAQGRIAEAAAVAQQAYAEAGIQQAEKLEGTLTTLDRLWRGVTGAVKEFWDAVGIGPSRPLTIQQELEAALVTAREQTEIAGTLRGQPARAARDRAAEASQQAAGLRELLRVQDAQASATAAGLAAARDAPARLAKDLEMAAARSSAAFAIMSAQIKGQIDDIESRARRGLLSPLEAIEQIAEKNVKALEVERSALAASRNLALERGDAAAEVARLEGQIGVKNVEIARARIDAENRIKELIYERVTAARELYEAERQVNREAIAAQEAGFDKIYVGARQAVRDYARGINEAAEALALERSLLLENDRVREVSLRKLEVRQRLEQRLEAIRRTEGLSPDRRQELSDAERAASAREAANVEGQAYNDEFKEVVQETRDFLFEQFAEGGRSARDYINSLFRQLTFRVFIEPVVRPFAEAVMAFRGGDGQGGGSAGIGSLNLAAGLKASFDAVSKAYQFFTGTGSGSLAGAFDSVFTKVFQATGLGARFGLSTSAGLTPLGSAISGTANAAAYVAIGQQIGRSISDGFGIFGGGSSRAVNVGTVAGALVNPLLAGVGAALGGLVNRAFGRRAPEVTDRGISGTFGAGGDFSGSTFIDTLERGGWFRSDRRSTSETAITGELERALDQGGRAMIEASRKYGAALGLPVTAIEGITRQIRVSVEASRVAELSKKYGEDLSAPFEQLSERARQIRGSAEFAEAVEADARAGAQAVERALGQFGEALAGPFASLLEPLQRAGETVADTLSRVGTAILSANEALRRLQIAQLPTTVAGGAAAVDLAERFGGPDALTNAAQEFYQAFFTPTERVEAFTRELGTAFGELGLVMPDVAKGAEAARREYRSLVQAQDLRTESGRTAFEALLKLSGAFDEIVTVTEDVTEAARELAVELSDAIDSALGRLLTPERFAARRYETIAAGLQEAGVTVDIGALIGASKDDILAFAVQFVQFEGNTDEARLAVVKAAEALAVLKDEAAAAAESVTGAVRRLDSFRSPRQRTASAYQNIAEQVSQINPFGNVEQRLSVSVERLLAATKDEILDFATSFAALPGVTTEAKLAILEAASALATLKDEADRAVAALVSGADAVVADFFKGPQLATYLTERIAQTLGEGGLDIDPANILGTTREDVLALWNAVGVEGKAAILEAYGAWKQLQEVLYGTGEAVRAYRRDTLSENIEAARLELLTPEQRIARLRARESTLFQEIQTAEDPVAVAETLQRVVIDRIRQEADLREKVHEDTKTALEEQIDSLERMKDLSNEVLQFTAELRFGDLSPFLARRQVGEAGQLFDATLERARGGDEFAQSNLVSNAQAYLQEAAAAFASGPQYAAIFERVQNALEEFGAQGRAVDPQLQAARDQLKALEDIENYTGDMLQVLLRLDEKLLGRQVLPPDQSPEAAAPGLQDATLRSPTAQTGRPQGAETQAATIEPAGEQSLQLLRAIAERVALLERVAAASEAGVTVAQAAGLETVSVLRSIDETLTGSRADAVLEARRPTGR